MLKSVHVFLCLLLLLCTAKLLHATEPVGTVRIGYIAGTSMVMDGAGGKFGYLAEAVERLSSLTLREYTLVPLSLNSAFLQLNSGEVDVLGLLTKTASREERFAFTENNLGLTKYVVVADKGEEIFYGDHLALRGKSIALLREDNIKRTLERYLVGKGIRMDFIYCDSVEELHKADADFHFLASHYFMPGKNIILSLETSPLYFVGLKKNTRFLRELDKAINFTLANNLYFFHDLHRKYYEDVFRQRTVLTEKQHLRMQDFSPYRVGFSASHRPFQYLDDESMPRGLSVSVFNLLQDKYGLGAQLKDLRANSEEEIMSYDILLSVVGDRKIKEEYFDATAPYLTEQMLLFSQNISSSSGVSSRPVLGVLQYSVLSKDLVAREFPEWSIREFSSLSAQLDAYKSRSISGLLTPASSKEYVLRYIGETADVSRPTNIVLPLRMYISKRISSDVLDVFNIAIEAITPSEVNELLEHEHQDLPFFSTLPEIFRNYAGHMLIIMVFVIIVALIELVSFENRNKKKLLYILNVDSLTGLASMRKFVEVVESTLKKALPNEYMLISADIDEFTLFNQVYGYEKGNDLIVAIGQAYKESFSDAVSIARLKDDIFLIFTKNKGSLVPLCTRERCTNCVGERAKEIAGESFTLSTSRGCYIIDDPALPVSTMIDYCNKARTHEKNIHGYSLVTFTNDMKTTLEMRATVLHTMNTALADKEFYMIYQPKVDLETLCVIGAEALVRWERKGKQPIYPDVFIPIFEENGFIVKLDYYTFESVCQFIHSNSRNKMLRMPPIAVNLSGFTLLHPETLDILIALLEKYDVHPSSIEIEITESALVHESESFVRKIQELKDSGFTVAMDDFGAGVSSLNRLRSIIVDIVKLDKVFLDSNLSKEKGSTVVENIVRMLKELNIKVVAEGVETAAHAEWLRNIHCDIAQGYYFAPPLKSTEYLAILRSNIPYTL